MNIYRFQVTLETKEVDVVIAAESDENAFKCAQIEVEKHYLKLLKIQEITLYEKKKIGKGGGYVLDETMD